MKKVFVLTMFGTPFPWINEFIDHVQHLERFGFYWKIFTANKIESKGNVEIIDMTPEQFADLCQQKVGVKPNMFMTESGVPSVHVTDFYVMTGKIFEDYLKDAAFWGITNLDVVYGRLDHYINDPMLSGCDIFTDDINTINGVFSLWRNTEYINNLFREIPDWEKMLAQEPCQKCMGVKGVGHTLYGTDEYFMTEIVKLASSEGKLRYLYPAHYPWHGHDRIEMHVPVVKLQIQEDGSLWELAQDINGPKWVHARPYIGREIMYFHFQRTKQWPQCLKKQ